MRSLVPLLLALVLLAPAPARALEIYELSGQLFDGENLAFAVINGTLVSSNPEPGDLPLDWTGTLTFDEANSTLDFAFGGSFTSPTRSYSFDVSLEGLFAGLDTTDPMTFSIFDNFLPFNFGLSFNRATGQGEFSWFDPDGVSVFPVVEPRSAEGTITSVTLVPEPAAALLALASAVALARRRTAV